MQSNPFLADIDKHLKLAERRRKAFSYDNSKKRKRATGDKEEKRKAYLDLKAYVGRRAKTLRDNRTPTLRDVLYDTVYNSDSHHLLTNGDESKSALYDRDHLELEVAPGSVPLFKYYEDEYVYAPSDESSEESAAYTSRGYPSCDINIVDYDVDILAAAMPAELTEQDRIWLASMKEDIAELNAEHETLEQRAQGLRAATSDFFNRLFLAQASVIAEKFQEERKRM